MIYPGSIRLLQSFLHPILVQGRAKLIEEESAKRYKLKTFDGNDIDTVFIDNRSKVSEKNNNGRTLVICSEGNAGFYEIGIMTTPIALKYSVLGWNHPGFGGSTVCCMSVSTNMSLFLTFFICSGPTISATRPKRYWCRDTVCYTWAEISAGWNFIIWLEYWWLFFTHWRRSVSRG